MKAIDLISEINLKTFLGCYDGCPKVPGAVVLRLSEEEREILKGLKSEDLQKMRCDWGSPRRKSCYSLKS
jgi:hypothetical protein